MFALPCFVIGKLSLRNYEFTVQCISDYNYEYLIKKAIKNMNGREFELFIAEIFFRLERKVEVTPASRDKGIDLIVDGVGIECKCYNKTNISSPIVLKLMGALKLRNLSNGIIITTSNYTKDAVDVCPEWISRWYTDDILRTCNEIKDKISFVEYLGYDIPYLEKQGIVDTQIYTLYSKKKEV